MGVRGPPLRKAKDERDGRVTPPSARPSRGAGAASLMGGLHQMEREIESEGGERSARRTAMLFISMGPLAVRLSSPAWHRAPVSVQLARVHAVEGPIPGISRRHKGGMDFRGGRADSARRASEMPSFPMV